MQNPPTFALQAQFIDGENVPIQFANMVGIQPQIDYLVINFGQAAPFFNGAPEEQRKQLESLGVLFVPPAARFAVSRSTAEQLFEQLAIALGFVVPGEDQNAGNTTSEAGTTGSTASKRQDRVSR